jgi:hypothetical protein
MNLNYGFLPTKPRADRPCKSCKWVKVHWFDNLFSIIGFPKYEYAKCNRPGRKSYFCQTERKDFGVIMRTSDGDTEMFDHIHGLVLNDCCGSEGRFWSPSEK